MPSLSHLSSPRGTEPRQAGTLAGGIPLPRSALIGREADLERVLAMLRRDDVPQLTIVGPGGVGKTRLALEVASDLGPSFADGVVVVRLASVRNPDLVLEVLAQALKVPESRGQALSARLQTFLRDRHVLLLLDNLEHLLDAVPSLAVVLAGCPGVKVLATSRSPLGLSGERGYPLDVLAPEAARALFGIRARALDPDLEFGHDLVPVVAAICDRLDRLPLAIELAAARVRVLPPRALLSRLDRRLDLLTEGPRDAHPRQRTMEATIAWSHHLLSEPERALFRRLGAFVGGFSLEAATFVAGDDGDVLDTLSALVGASLVIPVAGAGDEPRFTMLETIREFAVAQLAASGDEETVRDAHATWCVDLVERAAPHWRTSEQSPWMDRLEAEHDNLRAALAWTADSPRRQVALALIEHLRWFWFIHAHFREGKGWIERALAWTTGERTTTRVRILNAGASFTLIAGDPGAAMTLASMSLELRRQFGEIGERDIADALENLGTAAAELGDYPRSLDAYEEALAIRRRLDDGGPATQNALAAVLTWSARAARLEGDWARAIGQAEEALALRRRQGNHQGTVYQMFLLATAAEHQGNDARAASMYLETLHIADSDDLRATVHAFDGIMFLAAKAGRAGEAGRLYGAGERLYERLGIRVDTYSQQRMQRAVTMALDRIEEDAFRACVVAGRDLSLEEAISEARELAASLAAEPDPVAPPPFGLTRREREVLRLVADGRSNRAIAEALSISERTVEVHVLHIMTKLDVASRAAAAVLAVRQELA